MYTASEYAKAGDSILVRIEPERRYISYIPRGCSRSFGLRNGLQSADHRILGRLELLITGRPVRSATQAYTEDIVTMTSNQSPIWTACDVFHVGLDLA